MATRLASHSSRQKRDSRLDSDSPPKDSDSTRESRSMTLDSRRVFESLCLFSSLKKSFPFRFLSIDARKGKQSLGTDRSSSAHRYKLPSAHTRSEESGSELLLSSPQHSWIACKLTKRTLCLFVTHCAQCTQSEV